MIRHLASRFGAKALAAALGVAVLATAGAASAHDRRDDWRRYNHGWNQNHRHHHHHHHNHRHHGWDRGKHYGHDHWRSDWRRRDRDHRGHWWHNHDHRWNSYNWR